MVFEEISALYNSFIVTLPGWAQNFLSFFLFALLIVIYSLFIWKFYRWIAKKDILELNLNKYNKFGHPFFAKMLAGIFYFIEYIIILPFVIFIWFGIFSIFLILLTENLEVHSILLISAVIIAAIRMTAYYSKDLSKDVAKLLPFTLLAVSLINPDFFDVGRVLSQFNQIPSLLNQIIYYLLFLIALES